MSEHSTYPAAVERITLLGGAGHGVCETEAVVTFEANGHPAKIVLSCYIKTSDNPTLSKMQERIFQAISAVILGKDA